MNSSDKLFSRPYHQLGACLGVADKIDKVGSLLIRCSQAREVQSRGKKTRSFQHSIANGIKRHGCGVRSHRGEEDWPGKVGKSKGRVSS